MERSTQLNSSYQARTQKVFCLRKANSLWAILSESARKIFGFSFIATCKKEGSYQTANAEASQAASLILHQLCESIVKSMNSQCECSRQMDEHLSAIWSSERVRFIFQACLSHFSCLVLEGTACICGFSNARDRQLFYSERDCTLWAKVSRTSGFSFLRMQIEGGQVYSKGAFCLCLWFAAMAEWGRLWWRGSRPYDLRDGLTRSFCHRCSPSQDDTPSSTGGSTSAVPPSNCPGLWHSLLAQNLRWPLA